MGRETCAVLAATLLFGCPGFGSSTLEELEMPEEIPTWEEDVGPLLAANCAVCHTLPPSCGAPEGFRLDKYRMDERDGAVLGAFEKRMLILQRAVDAVPAPMPPEGLLPPEDRALIEAWVMAGAPRSREDVR